MMRYLLISCASGMAGVAGLTLFFSLIGLIGVFREIYVSGAPGLFEFKSFFILIAAPFMFFIFALAGMIIAAPAAMIFGGLMLILQNIFAICRMRSIWIAVGCVVGTLIARLMEPNANLSRGGKDFFWFAGLAFGGGIGAWVFFKLWHCTHMIPPLRKKPKAGD